MSASKEAICGSTEKDLEKPALGKSPQKGHHMKQSKCVGVRQIAQWKGVIFTNYSRDISQLSLHLWPR